MAITKKTRRVMPTARVTASSRMPARRTMAPARRVTAPRSINAGTSITANARRAKAKPSMISASVKLTPEQRVFANQLMSNTKRSAAIMGATNTSNIMAKPEFLELLPLFVQKLLILDVYGSVAMKSRQQLIPYFKFIAENDKGETTAIKKAFGDSASKVKINSTKSMLGHLLGAAGAVEAVATALQMSNGLVHQTVGYKVPDEDCDLDYCTEGNINMEVRAAISNSLGFGGHNATLCFKAVK